MEEKTKSKKGFIITVLILGIIILSLIIVIVVLLNNGGENKLSTDNKTKTDISSDDSSKNSTSKTDKSKNDNVKIVKSEVSNLELEEFSNSVFSMKKPTGWVVECGGTGIYYAIRVYDPKDNNNQIFLMLKIQPLLKSQAAKNQWQSYSQLSGNSQQYKVFTDAVVLNSPTVENFYKSFNEVTSFISSVEPTLSTLKFPTFSNFTKVEEFDSQSSMKSVAVDSKVLRATFENESSKKGEGLFMASIVNFGDQYQGGVDMSYYMVYDIMSVTASKDQFIDYKDILLDSINSIDFNDSYVKQTIDDGNAQTQNALAINASVQKAFDSYMSAWENRQTSYDIMSQKQSDATLGYERVYDTDTGDIYKAYNGFTDDYQGNRYKSVTDNMYTEKTSGYIEEITN